jgi:toxin CcdB
MAQFEVYANPVHRARGAYPFIVVLQADLAETGWERAVAPVAPSSAFPTIPGRLTPLVKIAGETFVLLVTSLTTIPTQGFGHSVASLADRREDILAAIDYLFFGL